MAIERNYDLHDSVSGEQTPEGVADWPIQSSALVHLDSGFSELGSVADEHCAMGGLRTQPSEMEKAEFEAAIWKAFAQCFVTYEEAVRAIRDFNLGELIA